MNDLILDHSRGDLAPSSSWSVVRLNGMLSGDTAPPEMMKLIA